MPRHTHHAPPASDPYQSSTVHVYESYDLCAPPEHPGPSWTRFVCISDNHSLNFHVPSGDVLIHAGDLTRDGTLKDLEVTLNWLKGLPHPTK